jgi:purine-nucleoside phosphorylase
MKFLGISHLFVSNASGGVNPDYEIGDLMILNDHVNLFPTNPLIGTNINELGPRFPDMSDAYDQLLIEKAVLKVNIYPLLLCVLRALWFALIFT